MKSFLHRFLAYPGIEHLDLDDPNLTQQRRSILKEKRFLRKIYEEWYASILESIPEGAGYVLELGSGAGFLNEFYPALITSEIFWLADNQLVLDGCSLPFTSRSLKAIVMTDVLHHIPQTRRFFSEACRCLREDGVIVMVEPWNSLWSGWVYRNLHHEPFDPQTPTWEFPSTGPLSAANGALPWIIFQRDRTTFESEYPGLKIETIQPIMPFRYLVSGGVSMRSLSPSWSFGVWKRFERWLAPMADHLGMFARIVIINRGNGSVKTNEYG